MNIQRRPFLAIGLTLLAASDATLAQTPGKVWRIGHLSNASAPDENIHAFREQLKILGYVEGRNLSIEYRWGAGREERLPELAAELVQLNVDAIIVRGQQSVAAAKRATSSIPIVMASVADAVGTGMVASLARPGGNITGSTNMSTELAAKRVQLLQEVIPGLARVAILVLKAGPATPLFLEQVSVATQQLGIAVGVHALNQPEAIADAFTSMQRARAQALIVQASPFTIDNGMRIVELATLHRMPVIFETRSAVNQGGFMSYGPSLSEQHRRAALYVDKIFKGAKPADLPVEQPSKFELVINLKAAKALGLTIPQSMLLRADEVAQ